MSQWLQQIIFYRTNFLETVKYSHFHFVRTYFFKIDALTSLELGSIIIYIFNEAKCGKMSSQSSKRRFQIISESLNFPRSCQIKMQICCFEKNASNFNSNYYDKILNIIFYEQENKRKKNCFCSGVVTWLEWKEFLFKYLRWYHEHCSHI